jgi:tetratricopeptide (TPR) repeat protein
LAGALVNRVLDRMTNSATTDLRRAEALVAQALAASGLHNVKGQVLPAQNQYGQAIPEYEAALALNRNSLKALIGLAQCKLYPGR